MRKIFFIDPQGGRGNLGMYDYELLSRINNKNIYFFGNKTYDYLPLSNIKCKFWFNYIKYKNPIIKGLSYVLTMLRILLAIFKYKPSVIHVQWIRIPIFDLNFYDLIKKTFKLKIVYTVHNLLPHTIGKNDYDYYKNMYELCDTLLVHTETTKNKLITEFQIDPHKILVTPHGPLNFIKQPQKVKDEKESIISKYQLQGKLIFSILGFQSHYKGTDLLIQAWRKSQRLNKRDDVVLIVAGSEAKKYIREGEIENIIVIDGFFSDITFNALLKMTDVILLPYRRIEQSGILLTLISESKPYCTTDVGELAVPIMKENIGWIIPEITSQAISKTLESIIDNPKDIDVKAKNKEGWRRIEMMYDWNLSAKITQKVYNEE